MDIKKINTAPKDYAILAWFPELGWVVAGFNEDDTVNNADGWAIGHDYYGMPPTHWTELPPPLNDKHDELLTA